jgi:hypothetical protein
MRTRKCKTGHFHNQGIHPTENVAQEDDTQGRKRHVPRSPSSTVCAHRGAGTAEHAHEDRTERASVEQEDETRAEETYSAVTVIDDVRP